MNEKVNKMTAFILARGGSKGLPGKNIIPFNGHPLIAHTIMAALEASCIDRVMVSTDDDRIAAVAQEYGAEAPFRRPEALASDEASARDALLHALDFVQEQEGEPVCFCLLQPTSPLRTADDIDAVAALFHEKKARSVLSVTAYEHPVQWAVSLQPDGHIREREKNDAVRRQDLVTYYRPNGAIYLFETAFFRAQPDYIGRDSFGYLMPPERSIDIDTAFDLAVAETWVRQTGRLS